jgi:hypothetical protein
MIDIILLIVVWMSRLILKIGFGANDFERTFFTNFLWLIKTIVYLDVIFLWREFITEVYILEDILIF